MGRVALRLGALLAGITIVVGAVLAIVAARRLDRLYAAPTPAIARATSPEDVAHGARLYRTACIACHTEPGAAHSCGATIRNFPTAFGTIVSSSLTRDRERGIGAITDGEIARLLRHGVTPDGRFSRTMPRVRLLGDDDIAALLGFLRSDDQLFAPCGEAAPSGRLSLVGRIALALLGPKAPTDSSFDPAPVPVPPRAATAAYGRYLAAAIYGCVGCHTDSVDEVEAKLAAPNRLAGGFEFPDPRGDRVVSTNLTPDPTGLAGWTLAQFQTALSTGISPRGATIRSPMPILLRFTDPVETEAIYRYLQSVPPVSRTSPPRPAAPAQAATLPPEEAFVALGCAPCHGQAAPFRDALRAVGNQPAEAIAAAIRNPERANPGTQMPTFAAIVDEARALDLARWLKENFPAKSQ